MELTGFCIEVLGGLDLRKKDGRNGQSTESRREINRKVIAHACACDKFRLARRHECKVAIAPDYAWFWDR